MSELVRCCSCSTRTLPSVAASLWKDGACTLCQDPEERREVDELLRRDDRRRAAEQVEQTARKAA